MRGDGVPHKTDLPRRGRGGGVGFLSAESNTSVEGDADEEHEVRALVEDVAALSREVVGEGAERADVHVGLRDDANGAGGDRDTEAEVEGGAPLRRYDLDAERQAGE